MMENKYVISVERENYVCDENGKLMQKKYRNFLKVKNNFIYNKNKIIILKSPKCNNFNECYDKFEEIFNVFSSELKKDELFILPYKDDLGITMNFSFDSNLIVDASMFKKIKTNIINNLKILNEVFSFSHSYDNLKNVLYSNVIDSMKNIVSVTFDLNTIKIKLKQSNLFDKCGIRKSDIAFVVCFMFFSLRHKISTLTGTYKDIIEEIFKANNEYHLGCGIELNIIKNAMNSKKENSSTDVYNSKHYLLSFMKYYYEDSFNTRYVIKNFPMLDGSAVALIKDAVSQGIDYKIIDESKSFVEFVYRKHIEYVILATMTNRDSYILSYITDDKQFAKNILRSKKISVPYGAVLNSNMDQLEKQDVIAEFEGKSVVIKPKSTNSGTGITIFSSPVSKNNMEKALEYAFKFDKYALIEEYIKGNEYRFLIVNNKCVGVVHRRSASVVGDGKSTVMDLIDAKNKEPWHKLLENPVVIDTVAENFLKMNGYTFESIPNNNERIFLRENSNCSTGGECIDVTEIMPQYYKNIAVSAAKCFNAKIAGVDIIIDDISSKKYSIIEVNDNPGYSLNEWPYEGKGEKIGLYILKMLGF